MDAAELLSADDAEVLPAFVGASSSLLDDDDLAQLAAATAPGRVAAVAVIELLGTLPLLAAWERDGARVVLEGPVLPDELLGALDATERTGRQGE